LISNEKLIELYSVMVKCRMIAERAGQLARLGKLAASLDSSVGREASIAGIAVDLRLEDTLSYSREVMVSEFLKGAPLEAIFGGLAAEASNGQRLMTAPAATPANEEPGLEKACAAAKSHKIAKTGMISVVFCGEARVHPGRWRRSLSVASRQNLPVIFVRHLELCDGLDNTPVKRKLREAPPEALAFGVPLIQVDGNDVVAVYRVASESIARARDRRGPTLIDCMTDISADHFGLQSCSDASKAAGGLDPIHQMESHLVSKGVWKANLKKKIIENFGSELDRATRPLVTKSNIESARTSASRPFNPGPHDTFIPGNDVL
jgi:TPP-dependent pyruvate/acetoin dehydrogenase alpha subunit